LRSVVSDLLRVKRRHYQQRHHQSQAVLHAARAVLANKPTELEVNDDDSHRSNEKQARCASPHPVAKNHRAGRAFAFSTAPLAA
jgi:hypothetical protein